MPKIYRSAPIIVMVVVLIVFAFTQWLPLLLLLPAGAAMMLAGKDEFTNNLHQKSRESEPPYE
ncbi:hypothetical protein [Paeniglutamicibacter terrestris]|uniref:Uncharacterized protein n=1 Tax=Paeniglutamicibacter terrestris TaxID=2723403 RepID=A0ABX1G874_9MICC|nr:hypothetical protein [Paeniglutamicibacter terrestris]ASN39418.1 hypothetical protein CGQ24_10595 [Arthrobacter sp. 7749]NKG21776.1 hypothetical protein [Paeniglutamicibacter terrestris]